ncbi:hypothetical protein [Desulfobacter curvatus]|uniref:hypothetical protein n=1 Tax=Desulfobacter curvatus TaxID=2290 RepID=UPI00037BFFA3|nr:hypothetical protein [Desulfobacter curvatus]
MTLNKLFIQQIEVKNSGDKTVDDIILLLSFTDEKIEKSKISIDQAISHSKEIKDKSLKLNIDSLNPGEEANVSILYQSNNENSSGASISLRAKGVKGKLIGSEKKQNEVIIALVAAYAGILAFILSTKRGRHLFTLIVKNIVLGKSLSSIGDQKYIIASLLSMYGYPEKAKDYLDTGVSRQYWVEADLLTSEAVSGDGELKDTTIKILRRIAELPQIHSTSKAIVYYNIARLYKSLNMQESDIEEIIDKAKKIDKTEVESRLTYDPIFLA